jgi:hypothetical protein
MKLQIIQFAFHQDISYGLFFRSRREGDTIIYGSNGGKQTIQMNNIRLSTSLKEEYGGHDTDENSLYCEVEYD